MTARAGRRGQPLLALAILLAGWIGLRLLGIGDPVAVRVPAPPGHRPGVHAAPRLRSALALSLAMGGRRRGRSTGPVAPGAAIRSGAGPALPPCCEAVPAAEARLDVPAPVEGPSAGPVAAGSGPVRVPDPGAPAEPAPDSRRWSGDGWLLLRNESGIVPGAGFYGASQLGGVLRYRLAPGDRHRLTLYLRMAAALAAAPEQAGAAGISVRPLPHLPVRLGIEGRATRSRFGNRLRAAAVAVTELPPQPLPLGFVADIYAQGGWISVPEPGLFGDLQLRTERPVVQAQRWQARAGAGLWLGGQRGASRLDVGPVLGLGGPVGATNSLRLELDWRWRLAGRAAPASGPALVLATSF